MTYYREAVICISAYRYLVPDEQVPDKQMPDGQDSARLLLLNKKYKCRLDNAGIIVNFNSNSIVPKIIFRLKTCIQQKNLRQPP